MTFELIVEDYKRKNNLKTGDRVIQIENIKNKASLARRDFCGRELQGTQDEFSTVSQGETGQS